MLDSGCIYFANAQGEPMYLLPEMANRHGLIAGATGTGKTTSLRVLVEAFSELGTTVILPDLKGDLSSFMLSGSPNGKVQERIDALNLQTWKPQTYPVAFWDVLGEQGMRIRSTVSELGPLFLARILELNDVQTEVLSIIFRIADDEGLLLLDFKDLRSIISYVSENAKNYRSVYGHMATATFNTLLRRLMILEEAGATEFLGEPSLDLKDLFRYDVDGKAIINILQAKHLFEKPLLYTTFMLWLITELYEALPEVGDTPLPKIVVFFDEAHLLFSSLNPKMQEKLEQMIRLSRSKGLSIFFVTQNPKDIPDPILGQLGHRILHGLRAFSAAEQRNIKAVADGFRPNPKLDLVETIQNLGTGEVILSFLNEEGIPSQAMKALVLPPESALSPANSDEVARYYKQDPLFQRYENSIDSESAYELLSERFEKVKPDYLEDDAFSDLEKKRLEAQEAFRQAQIYQGNLSSQKENTLNAVTDSAELNRLRKKAQKAEALARQEALRRAELEAAYKEERRQKRSSRSSSRRLTPLERLGNSAMHAVGREVGRSLLRGIFGNLLKR